MMKKEIIVRWGQGILCLGNSKSKFLRCVKIWYCYGKVGRQCSSGGDGEGWVYLGQILLGLWMDVEWGEFLVC